MLTNQLLERDWLVELAEHSSSDSYSVSGEDPADTSSL